MALASGTKLGPYEIRSPLGTGGMGEVYRAADSKLGRDVALKVILQEFTQDTQLMARFQREAQVLASLNHTNIAAIYGLEDSAGMPALVMELVEGPTLADRIKEGAIPLEEALPIAKQIAEALEYAHERGIIHRDLKPANIKVTHDGKVKVLDFGLAKALQGDAAPGNISNSPTMSLEATKAGIILGTAAYMSPEQARGKAVDRRADIWAFGVVFFEMLTGTKTFQGETVSDTLADVLRRTIDWSSLPPDTPPGVRRLLERCLERDPKRRLRDIGEARILLSDPDILAAPAPQPAPAIATRRRAFIWAGAAFAALVLATAGSFWISKRIQDSSPRGVTRLTIQLPAGQVLTSGAPAVSRDGRLIAYVAKGADNVPRLYLRALERYEPMEVPNSEGAMQPFFSPDGSRIAFFARGKLCTALVSGGPPTAIADTSFQPFGGTWGDDDTIVFVPALGSGLDRIPAAGGKPQRLTEPDEAAGGYAHVWPQFLPGGGSLLFTIWGGLNLSASGPAVFSLERGKWSHVGPGLWAPRYSQSGHLLVSGPHGVMAAAFDPNRQSEAQAQTFVVEDVFYAPLYWTSWFAVSDTGTLAYVPGDPTYSTLAWVDRLGAVTPVAGEPWSVADPALSPDGTRVVLGEDSNLWLVDLRRGSRVRLTQDNEGYNGYPNWSPDGAQVFFGSNRGGDWDIYSVSAGGGPAKRILARKGNQFPMSEAPNGTLLFAERTKGKGVDLYTLGPDGTVAPFVVSAANKVAGKFSPDGRLVAYVSSETGHDEVYLRSVEKPEEVLAVSSNGGAEPLWSPDGKELFYRRGDAFLAVSVNAAGALAVGNERKLFEMRAAWGRSPMHAGYAVAPDGRRFLILRPEPKAIPTQINVVLNWFEELKARVPTH